MDVTVRATKRVCYGRRSRVVLTPRRWRQARDDASHHTGDGGNKARSPGRARSKPLKPLRREGRIDPPTPVVTSVCFHFLHTDRGCSGHPAFPAPSLEGRTVPSVFEGHDSRITRAPPRRGNEHSRSAF